MRRVLLNPGPVTISETVRQSLIQPDNCHREKEICDIIQGIRKDLVSLAGGDDSYTSTLFASSGTGALEAVMSSIVPPESDDGKILIISNGEYGQRLRKIALSLNIDFMFRAQKTGAYIDVPFVQQAIKPGAYSYVFMVHHETTTGILNPIRAIGELVSRNGAMFVVDAISSFGGIPIDIKENKIDFLITTANKCIQGIPGLSMVIGKKAQIEEAIYSRSFYFNLLNEWNHQEQHNMLRFTAPIQTIYALQQAIKELKYETIEKRHQRYSESYQTLVDGYKRLGFTLYPTHTPSNLLATFYEPKGFDFERFHDLLYNEGYVIYPGKITDEKTFRIAVMGDINKNDIIEFLKVSKKVLREMEYG